MISEFWQVFTDPAHALSEVASSIVIDGIFILLIYQTLIKRYLWPKWHKQLDDEHGYEHEPHKHVAVTSHGAWEMCKCGVSFKNPTYIKDNHGNG